MDPLDLTRTESKLLVFRYIEQGKQEFVGSKRISGYLSYF